MRKKALIFILCLVLFSCDFFKDESEIFLVEVYGKELFYKDVEHLFSPELDELDSLNLINNLREKWVKEQLLLQIAKINLPLVEQNVKSQVESYENALLIYSYQQELLKQKLDSIISEQEIQKFYSEKKNNFLLKDDIVKVNYIKLKREVPYLWKVKSFYKNNDEESRVSLEDYCYQFSQEYFIEDKWQYVKDVFLSLPNNESSKNYPLRKGKSLEFTDDEFHYFLYVKEYKSKGSVSPLSMIENQIRSIILNRRKISFLEETEMKLYETALSKNYIRYEKK